MESKARRKSHNRAVAFAMAVLMLGTSGYSALPESISTSITANAVTTTEVPEGYTAVSTVEDLYAIRANPSGKYILMNDIDLSETAKGGDWDGGNGWTPIPSFSGILDGNGYTVSNMNIFGTNIYAGFIKNNAGEIKNISFDGVAINVYNSSVCGIITVNNTGKLTNCTVNMNIIVNGEGNINCGAITANNSGYITYCSADGSISGVCSSGTVGFISASSSNHIYKCCGTGIIKLSSSSSVCAGGITGSYSHKLTNSTDIGISECFSSVDIDLNDCSSCIIGGIVGICNYYDEVYTYRASEGYGPYERVVTKTGHIYHTTNIDNCYNSGTLLGTGKVAGIVATKGCGIQQCINFSDGRIFDNDLEHTGNISNVYCKSGSKFGLGGTPLTEPLMKQQASYLGLDFTNTWEMFNGRPRLKNNPENFVTQINFSKRPTKLTFYQGDELVTDGSLEVTYSDNTVRNVNITTAMLSGYDMNTVGNQTVTVTYKGFTVTYPINVLAINVTSITLDKTELNLNKGDSEKLTAAILPNNATDKTVTWSVSDSKIASVDQNGNVTALKAGSTTVTATSSNGKKATCTVNVKIPANKISLDVSSKNLNVGDSFTLKATLTPTDSTEKIKWSSENIEVAEVDKNGKVTAKLPGATSIIVETDSGIYASCYIQVSAPAKEISLDRSSIKMYTDESAELTCKVSPEYTTDEVEWSCNNDVVEIVKNNDKSVVIYPCKKGTATVTVTTTSGKKAACAVQVEQIAYGIYFENDYLMLNKGESKKVNPVKDPSDSVDNITWSSENSNIASVDSDGNITGVARGSTTIIAQTMRGYRAYVYVDVNVPATEVKLDKSEIEMFTEDSAELTCTISPDDTTDEIIWSCNNNVVEYYYSSDYNRIIIYPLKVGTAVITAASTSGKTATCTIHVNQHANGISFNSKSLKVAKGESKKLTPIFQPADAVDTIKWSSENTSIATVDNDGNVKGIKSGTTTVTAETANGYKAEIQVEVIVLATGIELDTTEATIFNNETLKLNAILSPSDSTDSVKWTSSDNSVASVDSEGNVKGISKGTATITATTSSGETAVCEITVNLGANAVTLDKKNTALNVGDTLQLKAAVTPSDSVSSVTWSSDNANIVSVDENGLVTAKAPGTVNVTVETSNGFSDSCEITVTQPSSEIDLKKTNVTVVKGNYTVLKSILTPADSTDTVIWSSNNNAVATVDSDGKVIGVSVGNAVITAETSSGKKITCNVTVKEIVNSVSVNRSTLNMRKGTTGILKADVSPADVYAEIMWNSSDKNIVAVDSNGVLTAKNVGTATITAKTTKGLKSSCVVTVDNPSTEITFNKTSASINVNETVKLNYTITPSDTTETVTWTTSNNSIATVSNGTVKGIKAGTVTITAKTSSGRYATCTVEVKQPQATSVSLSQTSVTLTAGNTVNLKATVSPTAANQTVTWTTSNSSVATVSNGTVKAVKAGTATITAKTSNGKTATCTVTVQAATVNPTSVSLNKTSMTLTAGSSTTLTATVYPTNATNKSVTWTTSNSSVATVSNGTVKAVKAGTATITAKTSNGKTATCTVTVKAATVNPTSVSLNKTSVSIDVGSTTTLTATVSPTNATDKSVIWTTSNSSVATVSNGTVKGIKAGTATITVKTSNGKTATCTVTVKVKETQPNISSNCQKLKEFILANPDTTDENGNNAIIYSHNIGNDPLTSAIVYIENIDAFNLIFLKDIDLGRRILENATDIKYYYSSNQVEETELYMETFDSQFNKGYNATLEKKAEDYYKNQDLSAQYSIINIVSMDNDEFKSNVNSERDMAFSEFNTLLKNKLNMTLNDIGFINFDKDNNSQQVEVSVVFLDKQQLTMNIGETATIKAAVGPDNAVNREVFWTSNNESVAKVSNGTITAIGTGTAVITAKTANGKYDTCTVTVNGNSTSAILVNCQNLKNYIIDHYTYTTFGGFKSIKLESTNSNGEKTYTQFSYDHKTDKLIMVYNVSFNDDGFYQSSFHYDYNKGTLEESEVRFHYSSEFALSCHEQKSSDVTNKLIAPYSVVSSKGYSSSQYQKYALEQHEMALANIDMYLYSIMTINLKDIGFTNYDMFAY